MKRIALIALLAVGTLLLAACSPRDVISVEEFTTRMEGAGHDVIDLTEGFAHIPGMVAFVFADAGDFDVEFSVWETESAARLQFNNIHRQLEDAAGNTRSYRSTSVANFNRFTQTTSGRFEALVRVENTLLLIEASSGQRSAVEAVLDLLGY